VTKMWSVPAPVPVGSCDQHKEHPYSIHKIRHVCGELEIVGVRIIIIII